MATPNRPWRAPRAISKGPDKPAKDFWDRIESVGKGLMGVGTIVGAIWIPIQVAKIGGSVQSAIADRTLKIQQAIARQNTGKDYLNVALSILEQKDFPENLKKNQGLRKWAVDLLKNYSDVPIDDTTAAELVSGETRLPKVVDAGRVVATERMEAAAKDEITATLAASADGLLNTQVTIAGNLCVFNRDGLMVRAFPDGLPYLKGAAFSPDDRYLVTYDSGHLAVVTLTGNLSIATPVHLGGIQSVAFSGNNVIVVTDHNGKETKYDVTGKEMP